MALGVFTNVASLNAQRQVSKATSSLSVSFERLSSGLRINGAKDDAAGLAIAERMDSRVRGSDQARRNVADGISLAQTAEGALGEIGGILQRLRELSVQAANDSNNASDRQSLDNEANQLVASLDQIASSTEFNGKKITDGSTASLIFQTGADNAVEHRVQFDLVGVKASQLGSLARQTNAMTQATNGAAIAGNGDVVINGVNIVSSATYGTEVRHSATNTQNGSSYAKAKAINASAAGVKAVAEETARASTAFGAVAAAYTLTINDVQIFNNSVVADANDLAARINQKSGETGVTAEVNGTNYTLKAADGRNINATSSADANGFLAAGDTSVGSLTFSSESAISVSAGGVAIGFAGATGSIAADSNDLNSKVDLTSRSKALESIDRIDAAINKVASGRAKMGAIQSRLEATSSNLSSVSENLSAARSRIRDADFAMETAMLTRNQILQQASSAILSQANQSPQQALQLLRG